MPALGGAAFRPKKQFAPKKNDDDGQNDEIDFDHDDVADLPILDDATRKMIMRDIQRGKVPSFENNNNTNAGAYGTGIQGASYLLQEKEKREQELQAMMRQVRLSGGQPPPSSFNNNKDILKRIQPEPTTKSTGTQPSARPSAMISANSEPQPQPPSQQPTRRLIVHRRQSEEHVPELNNGEETNNAQQQQQQRQQEKPEKLDADLVDVMATRLRFLEKQNSFLQSEVKEKSIKLSNCQNKLSDTEEAVAKLQTERVILAEKIASMSRFLADYGLKWVGDEDKKENDKKDKENKHAPVKKFDLYAGNVSLNNKKQNQEEDDEEKENRQKHDQDAATGFDDANGTIEDEIEKVVVKQSSKTYNQARTPPRAPAPTIEQDDPSMNNNESSSSTVVASSSVRHFDFDKFVNMCAALSAKVSQHVFSSKNTSKQSNQIVSLRQREVVVVTVFADGITVAGGPFRPFGWALCDAFVQDVMDGYFPYEYRGRYPDGFPIDVVDKREERYLVVPGGNNNHQLDPESLSSIANTTPTKNNNNKKNKIRTLQDSPYSLRKHHNNNNNPTNSKSSPSTAGHKLGGMRHAGVVSGAVATRDLILRRIPTRYVTASGRIINPAAGIAEFLNLPPEKLTSTMKPPVTKNDKNSKSNQDIIPQTPPRFSLMKNYKGPQIVVAAAQQSNDDVEKNLNFDDEGNNNSEDNCQIRLRALFPSSGDQVDISINNHQNFTVSQLQEAILSAASNQGILLRPPIDLNDHDHDSNNNNNNNYEMEFIVRRGNNTNNENEGMTTTTTGGPTTSFSAEDNDGMGSRQTSEFLTNANNNTNTKKKIRRETIVVRWRKIVKKN